MQKVLFFTSFLTVSLFIVEKILKESLDSVSTVVNGYEYLLQSLGKGFIRLKHIEIFEMVQNSNNKIVSKEAPEYNY